MPSPLLGCTDPTLRDALLAMVLAKIGSHEPWTTICYRLHLPKTHANRIGTYLRLVQARGTWPAIHTALANLITQLQHDPPPIDYERRRTLGRNTDLLTDAVKAGRRRHPTDTDERTLTRQFWERFTGGNIAYAPGALQLDPATPAYADYRRTNPLLHADLFHSAQLHLRTHHHVDGPLRWTPPTPSGRHAAPAGGTHSPTAPTNQARPDAPPPTVGRQDPR